MRILLEMLSLYTTLHCKPGNTYMIDLTSFFSMLFQFSCIRTLQFSKRRSLRTQYQAAQPRLNICSEYRKEDLFLVLKTATCERNLRPADHCPLTFQPEFLLERRSTLNSKSFFRKISLVVLWHFALRPLLSEVNKDYPYTKG